MPYETQEISGFPEVRGYGTEIADSGYELSDFEVGDRVVCVGIYDDQSVIVGQEGVVRAFLDDEIGVDFETTFGQDSNYFNPLHDLNGRIKDYTGWWLPPSMLIPVPQKNFEEEIKVDFDSLFSESEA